MSLSLMTGRSDRSGPSLDMDARVRQVENAHGKDWHYLLGLLLSFSGLTRLMPTATAELVAVSCTEHWPREICTSVFPPSRT